MPNDPVFDRENLVLDEPGLVQAIGRKSPALDMKIIDHLDDSAIAWMGSTRLVFTSFANEESTCASLMQADGINVGKGRLRVPLSNLEESSVARIGAAFGSLWLIPGVRETLRINGRIESMDDESFSISVDECYIHCGKALIRSDFWEADASMESSKDLAAIVANARFVAVATSNAAGEADLSPKGDPSGTMVQLIDGQLCLAERPGNRRADSLRNMLVQPQIALLLLIPGSNQIATLTGIARITTAPEIIEKFTVRSKVPSLVVQLSDLAVEIQSSKVLEHASLWPQQAEYVNVDAASVIAAHISVNKSKGFSAWLMRRVVRLPGFVRKSLDSDYKKRLY